MLRCFQLAKLGIANVAPNPMVGAILVYNDEIIGEGMHNKYGEAHAEVNCVNSVAEKNKKFIPQSTMYVSLEPCSHFGKTPPCTDLILRHGIKNIVIACRDNFEKVNGIGIEKLKQAGVNIVYPFLESEAIDINKRFFCFHKNKRPYIILKWAESANGFIAGENNEHISISNQYSNRLVHKWRAEETAIMVGTETVMADNPLLTTRLWHGKNPIRVILDRHLKISADANVYSKTGHAIIVNSIKSELNGHLEFVKIDEQNVLPSLMKFLYDKSINSVLVEGGAKLLQSFIDAALWDEARIIKSKTFSIKNGLAAPKIYDCELAEIEKIDTDDIHYYKPKKV